MGDDDLVRRGDIEPRLAEAGFGGSLMHDAIAYLPAVTVGVKPLVWEEDAKARGLFRATCPVLGYFLAFGEEKRREQDANRNARILSALEPAVEATRISRNGEHLFQTAKTLGWDDAGEGALEFVMRRTREMALEDAAPDAAIREDSPNRAYRVGYAAGRAAALREAAEMVMSTAYTNIGEKRSLEPVSASLVGMDMHHATIGAAILALLTEKPHDRA